MGSNKIGTATILLAFFYSLNYKKYFVEGEERISTQRDYTSHNTRRLSMEEIKEILLREKFVQAQLAAD